MMKSASRAVPLLSMLVLAAIWMGGCESFRNVEGGGMLGSSLLVVALGALLIGLLEFGPPRRL